MSEHTIKIVDGHLQFVYDDALGDLLDEGTAAVCRVSHVEPHPAQTGWLADMQPVGGPVIGATGLVTRPHRDCDCTQCEAVVLALTPFKTRHDALAAEREWLTKERGL